MNFFRRLRQSNNSNEQQTILILASLRPGCGNLATAQRLAHGLELLTKFSVDCISIDNPQTELDSILTSIDRYSAIIGLHVYRTGNFLSKIYRTDAKHLPPLILIFAGTELHSCESKWTPTIEYILPFAKGLVCFNYEWKKHVEMTYKNNLLCKITVIPQSVLLSSFIFEQMPFLTNRKVILWIGEIRSVKDPLFAIRFLSHLNNNDYHLLLIGHEQDSTLVEYLRSSYSNLNLTFLGVQSPSFIHTLMRTAFAYINTSINEGMCLAILEAMTLGLPVLARRNIGNSSIIKHGKTGLLFDRPDEAVQCLLELDTNDKLRNSLTCQAENYVRKSHYFKTEIKSYRNLIFDLIK